MADCQTSRLKTVSEEYEPLFFIRMIGIVEQAGVLVEKHGLGFFEGHAVFCQVGSGLANVPNKPDIAHSIILAISFVTALGVAALVWK